MFQQLAGWVSSPADDVLSPNKMSDLLFNKNTRTNETSNTTKPIDSVSDSCDTDGFKKMRALISRHVDSVHVE